MAHIIEAMLGLLHTLHKNANMGSKVKAAV